MGALSGSVLKRSMSRKTKVHKALQCRKRTSASSAQNAALSYADESKICVVTSLQEAAFWRGTPYCWPMPLGGHEHVACSRAYLDELSKQHPDLINVTVKGSDGASFDEVRIPGSESQLSASGCNAAFCYCRPAPLSPSRHSASTHCEY